MRSAVKVRLTQRKYRVRRWSIRAGVVPKGKKETGGRLGLMEGELGGESATSNGFETAS